jgi:NADPH-dependent 2,4-dienoyl-CoA reductase/sulfur reductase-like enzyme
MINQSIRPEAGTVLTNIDVDLQRRQVLTRKSESTASELRLDRAVLATFKRKKGTVQ